MKLENIFAVALCLTALAAFAIMGGVAGASMANGHSAGAFQPTRPYDARCAAPKSDYGQAAGGVGNVARAARVSIAAPCRRLAPQSTGRARLTSP